MAAAFNFKLCARALSSWLWTHRTFELWPGTMSQQMGCGRNAAWEKNSGQWSVVSGQRPGTCWANWHALCAMRLCGKVGPSDLSSADKQTGLWLTSVLTTPVSRRSRGRVAGWSGQCWRCLPPRLSRCANEVVEWNGANSESPPPTDLLSVTVTGHPGGGRGGGRHVRRRYGRWWWLMVATKHTQRVCT